MRVVVQGLSCGGLGYCAVVQGVSRGSLGNRLLSKASPAGAWAIFFHYVYVVQGISRGSLGYCVVVQGISRGSLGDEFLSKASPIGAWAEEWEGGVKKYSSEFVYRA